MLSLSLAVICFRERDDEWLITGKTTFTAAATDAEDVGMFAS